MDNKYEVVLTTTYTYVIDARNGDEAIKLAYDYKKEDIENNVDTYKEDSIIVTPL